MSSLKALKKKDFSEYRIASELSVKLFVSKYVFAKLQTFEGDDLNNIERFEIWTFFAFSDEKRRVYSVGRDVLGPGDVWPGLSRTRTTGNRSLQTGTGSSTSSHHDSVGNNSIKNYRTCKLIYYKLCWTWYNSRTFIKVLKMKWYILLLFSTRGFLYLI